MRRRRKLLSAIQAEWGKSHQRSCATEVLTAHFHSRTQIEASRDRLDDRTWGDLDLDSVVQAVDRTESTLGQQALYYRVRTTWTAE
jgi:hypothetical protein